MKFPFVVESLLLIFQIEKSTSMSEDLPTKCEQSRDCEQSQGYFCTMKGICGCIDGTTSKGFGHSCTKISRPFDQCGWIRVGIPGNVVDFNVSALLTCPVNSFCSNDNICLCQQGYIPTREGGCVPELITTDKKCTNNLNCDVKGQICLNGDCLECFFGNPVIHNNSEVTCELKYGDYCRKPLRTDDPATPNTISGYCPGIQFCDHDSSKCSCQSDYTWFNDKILDCELLPKFGDNCSLSQKCQKSQSSNMYCIDNVCKCQLDADYDIEKEICLNAMLGSKCQDNRNCPTGSRCNADGKCVCNESDGFFEIGWSCEPNLYGKACTGTLERLYGRELIHRKIKCIDGIYQCQNPVGMSYNSKLRKCVNFPGSYCNNKLENECPKNSKCKITWEFRSFSYVSKCRCELGFSPTPYGQCLKHFGGTCEEHGSTLHGINLSQTCNMFKGFACINHRCQCLDRGMFYLRRESKCVSPQGYFCGRREIPGMLELNSKITDDEKTCYGCSYYYFDCEADSKCMRDTRILELGIGASLTCRDTWTGNSGSSRIMSFLKTD